ncbi:hypothetical protein GCM10027285_09620 [Oleiagrimonas citrea]|uniref:DUF6869 domain-containing protein n=1 Tax=Oleiagrimonas citrea TaxID=1665687 RepID=A0A846ZLP1_9GAMM|nr:hypothetical protein [Oleiagrimonas citrea]NKZ38478.1 hypothetical protein [Oleiagrimonas citrea]
MAHSPDGAEGSCAKIAEAWIHLWSGPETPAIGPDVGDSPLDWTLPREEPKRCLEVILEILERIDTSSPNDLLAVLAAGPLEDLLVMNGPAVIDEIETLARQRPPFRRLLNGVWYRRCEPDIRARLAKYLRHRW